MRPLTIIPPAIDGRSRLEKALPGPTIWGKEGLRRIWHRTGGDIRGSGCISCGSFDNRTLGDPGLKLVDKSAAEIDDCLQDFVRHLGSLRPGKRRNGTCAGFPIKSASSQCDWPHARTGAGTG